MVPSFLSHIIASLTLAIPAMILAETALSFLGLGLQPPVVSWGVLLQEAQNIRSVATAPWLLLPGVAVVIAVLSLNFLGDGLRDAADPYESLTSTARRCSGSRGLKTHFGVTGVKAVDGVDLAIRDGETLCVVGESGLRQVA